MDTLSVPFCGICKGIECKVMMDTWQVGPQGPVHPGILCEDLVTKQTTNRDLGRQVCSLIAHTLHSYESSFEIVLCNLTFLSV